MCFYNALTVRCITFLKAVSRQSGSVCSLSLRCHLQSYAHVTLHLTVCFPVSLYATATILQTLKQKRNITNPVLKPFSTSHDSQPGLILPCRRPPPSGRFYRRVFCSDELSRQPASRNPLPLHDQVLCQVFPEGLRSQPAVMETFLKPLL